MRRFRPQGPGELVGAGVAGTQGPGTGGEGTMQTLVTAGGGRAAAAWPRSLSFILRTVGTPSSPKP